MGFKFVWAKLKPREWALRMSIAFSGHGLDAGNDRCLYPGCGVERKVHGRDHEFVEKAP